MKFLTACLTSVLLAVDFAAAASRLGARKLQANADNAEPIPNEFLIVFYDFVDNISAKVDEYSEMKFAGADKQLFDDNSTEGDHEIKGQYEAVLKGLTITNMSRGLLEKLEDDPHVSHIVQVSTK